MTTVHTPETKDSSLRGLSSHDIYHEARSEQLTRLCGKLASWGADKYQRPPTTHRPGRGNLDTKLIVIEGDELIGWETASASSRASGVSIEESINKEISDSNDPENPDETDSIIARLASPGGDSESGYTLSLEFTDDESNPIHKKRQGIRSVMEEVTSTNIPLTEEYEPSILLMQFEPETISLDSLQKLSFVVQKKALPMPITTGKIILPAWMRKSS